MSEVTFRWQIDITPERRQVVDLAMAADVFVETVLLAWLHTELVELMRQLGHTRDYVAYHFERKRIVGFRYTESDAWIELRVDTNVFVHLAKVSNKAQRVD